MKLANSIQRAPLGANANDDSEGEIEEGELRIYDKDSYIDSNG